MSRSGCRCSNGPAPGDHGRRVTDPAPAESMASPLVGPGALGKPSDGAPPGLQSGNNGPSVATRRCCRPREIRSCSPEDKPHLRGPGVPGGQLKVSFFAHGLAHRSETEQLTSANREGIFLFEKL
jgi:hypothetical protein